MRTNQTKFTVALSDLSWDTVDFDETVAPIYPKAWQVYRFPNHYVRKYIPDEVFRFNTRVVRTAKVLNQNGDEQPSKWTVTTKPTRSAAD
jgi:cation diffusion facilitator CzcD-associated flavoprotein CzcO